MCLIQLTGDHESLLIFAALQVLLFIKLKFFFRVIIVHLSIVLKGQEFGTIAHARSAVGLGGFANLVIVVADLVVKLKLLVGIVVVVDPTALALIVGCCTIAIGCRPLGPAQEAESLRGQIDGLHLPVLVLEGVDSIGIPSLGGDLIYWNIASIATTTHIFDEEMQNKAEYNEWESYI